MCADAFKASSHPTSILLASLVTKEILTGSPRWAQQQLRRNGTNTAVLLFSQSSIEVGGGGPWDGMHSSSDRKSRIDIIRVGGSEQSFLHQGIVLVAATSFLLASLVTKPSNPPRLDSRPGQEGAAANHSEKKNFGRLCRILTHTHFALARHCGNARSVANAHKPLDCK